MGYSKLKMPSPHRGYQSLFLNLPGNPDSKIVSKCENPHNFCKNLFGNHGNCNKLEFGQVVPKISGNVV